MSHPLLPVFQQIPLFAGIDAEEIVDLARAISPGKLRPGERLFQQGDPGEAAWILESGELVVEVLVEGSVALRAR